ncbi:hypothetical protein C0Q70_08026 [Pomacea canaliculata]|uniref:Uncharacterized protein n=3 Tax=Pomacea canaliculata TaxID=400727 RepID=A0A2T7PGM9_POMCA|nr:hypothetical protein C0Q70_08026 [Pomacea canaliculata]
MEAPPLYSQGLLTVEQLSQVAVDADIQAAVSEFLSGLSTQMFARIVRNGSAEVGGWLGAKIQGERNGWTTRLKMAMGEIELHRKHALLWGSALLDTSDHLALLDFLNVVPQEPTVPEVTLDNMAESVHKLVDAISERCSTLLEDRFECCQALNATIPPPARVSPVLNETLKKLEQELARIEDEAVQAEVESSKVRNENARMLAEVSKSQEEMKKKQSEMEMLKVQLKEIGKVVKVRKHTTAEKGVDTSSDFNSLKTIVHADCVGRVTTQSQGVNTLSTKRENMFTQTTRQPSIIEISEDKLRILKDRAKKLEHSIHDAISSMDKLKKGILYEGSPKEALKTSRTTSKLSLHEAT